MSILQIKKVENLELFDIYEYAVRLLSVLTALYRVIDGMERIN